MSGRIPGVLVGGESPYPHLYSGQLPPPMTPSTLEKVRLKVQQAEAQQQAQARTIPNPNNPVAPGTNLSAPTGYVRPTWSSERKEWVCSSTAPQAGKHPVHTQWKSWVVGRQEWLDIGVGAEVPAKSKVERTTMISSFFQKRGKGEQSKK